MIRVGLYCPSVISSTYHICNFVHIFDFIQTFVGSKNAVISDHLESRTPHLSG